MQPRKKSSRRVAGRVVKRTLADGTVKEYRYAPYKKSKSRVGADSVEALIRAYKQSPEWARLSPRTKSGYTIYLRPLDGIAHLSIKAVVRRDIIVLRNAISTARGIGAATGFSRATSALFGWAVETEQLERSPFHKIKRLEGGHWPAWTVDQAEKALAGLPEHFRRAVILGVYTGQRRGDLCSIKWSAYDGERLTFTQQKTDVVVIVTATPDLKAELDEWKGTRSPDDTILTDAKGRPWVANKLSVTLPKALEDLKLPKGLNVHGLRKLFAAAIAERGGTTNQIAAGTGHRTLAMVQLYTKSADQRIMAAEAVALLPRFGKKTEAENALQTENTTDDNSAISD